MTKDFLRKRVWRALDRRGVLRFPRRQGLIPNFIGANRAASRLRQLPAWSKARRVLMSSHSPQLPLRRRALAEGKILYLFTPGLRHERCFIEVNPKKLGRKIILCTSLTGAMKHGRLVSPAEVPIIDLIVCGSMVVRRDGTRVGPGDGLVDLVYAILREEGRVKEQTLVATTVHPLQVVREHVPTSAHDVAVDFVVTAAEATATHSPHPRPRGLYWDLLSASCIDSMPPLRHRLHRCGANHPHGL